MAPILLAIVLAACTNAVPGDLKAGTKKIAVISFAGQNFHALENVRPTSEAIVKRWMELEAQLPIRGYGVNSLFDRTETRRWKHDISLWSIDPFIVSTAAKILAPTYNVVPFAQRRVDIDFDGHDGIFAYDGEKFAGKVAEIVRAQPGFAAAGNVDAYVVVLPGDWLMMGRERISYGLGMFRTFFSYDEKTPKGQGTYVLHAFYYVMVLDGRSLEMIAGDAARNEDDRQGLLKGHPGAYVGPEYWAPSFDALSSDQQAMLAETLKIYLADSLPPTLRKLDLIP